MAESEDWDIWLKYDGGDTLTIRARLTTPTHSRVHDNKLPVYSLTASTDETDMDPLLTTFEPLADFTLSVSTQMLEPLSLGCS